MTSAQRMPVLVYDGECGFCSASARWIAAQWSRPADMRAYQQLGAEGLAALGLTMREAQSAAWWVGADGRRWRGHLAVAHALMQAHGWRRLAGRVIATKVMYVPAALGYALVARYRHLLSRVVSSDARACGL